MWSPWNKPRTKWRPRVRAPFVNRFVYSKRRQEINKLHWEPSRERPPKARKKECPIATIVTTNCNKAAIEIGEKAATLAEETVNKTNQNHSQPRSQTQIYLSFCSFSMFTNPHSHWHSTHTNTHKTLTFHPDGFLFRFRGLCTLGFW